MKKITPNQVARIANLEQLITNELDLIYELPFHNEQAKIDTLIIIFSNKRYYKYLALYKFKMDPALYIYIKDQGVAKPREKATKVKHILFRRKRGLELPDSFYTRKEHGYKR